MMINVIIFFVLGFLLGFSLCALFTSKDSLEGDLLSEYNSRLEDEIEELKKDSSLEYYKNALTDAKFLEYNYGVRNVDIHLISSFSPTSIIRDYKVYIGESDGKG